MQYNKFFGVIAALALAVLTGCGAAAPAPSAAESGEEPLRVVATVFPAWDWLRELTAGQEGRVELTLLQSGGVDMHSYQPTARDLLTVQECDLLVCVGGQSDAWLERALAGTEDGPRVVRLVEELGEQAYTALPALGTQAEEDHDHDHEKEADEHVWLSVANARTLTGLLAETLAELDPAGDYAARAAAYGEQLDALDESYRQAVEAGSRTVLLFGDRFPFAHLARDYGLTCYAAFEGCSAETEASFATVARLAAAAEENGLHTILITETSDGSLADTIAATTQNGLEKAVLNSMQAVSEEQIENGLTWLAVMEANREVLAAALA
ncbi:zinc ABC transporter substrate-binding protein [Gemmiger formicilis]|uniref:metal ABC transporter substrate-binding protein n=1 Tax=Gemmiger formicilis TaxID=745368 RepID=UPI00195E611A|nr:metal ABC transporter substrate-binding protein [Gemmiger formicilis]MBM6915564.1 zinc ABC transporter substrate-binding protein [Gemmiger formicilis]